MKINISKYSLSFLLLIIISSSIYSQNGMVVSQLSNVQQTNYLNPAFQTNDDMTIGIPGLSSIYLKVTNTFFQPNKLFTVDQGETTFNKNNFKNSLKDINYFGTQASFEIFSFAIKTRSGNFSFSIREKIDTRLALPKDFLAFPMTGNANFDLLEDGTLDFSDLRVDVSHYREFNLGLQKNLSKYLSVGGRVKFLYGYENIDFKKSEILWITNEDTWDWELAGEIAINTSGIIPDSTVTETSSPKDYIFKRKNRGIGIDLGTTYEINDQLTLSASLIDLGYIEWKTNVQTTKTEDANFIYSGLELSEDVILGSGIGDSLSGAGDELLDDFFDAFSLENDDDTYKTFLTTNINLGLQYKLNNSPGHETSLGFLMNTELYKKKLHPSFGFSFQKRFTKYLNTAASYSIQNGDFKNLGLGLAANFGVFQFYTSLDNVFSLFSTPIQFGNSGGAIPFPSFSKTTHIHFGMNLAFPQKTIKRGIPVKDGVGGISGNEGYRKPTTRGRSKSYKRKKRKKR